MAIRNKQIGWSQEANLLWQISYQLDKLIKIAGGPYTTTTTTTTTSLFSNTIYWGEDSATACGETIPITVIGDGTTFCNSNDFTSNDFSTIGTGGIFISYGGQIKTVLVTLGSNIATFNGGCDPCV